MRDEAQHPRESRGSRRSRGRDEGGEAVVKPKADGRQVAQYAGLNAIEGWIPVPPSFRNRRANCSGWRDGNVARKAVASRDRLGCDSAVGERTAMKWGDTGSNDRVCNEAFGYNMIGEFGES